MADSSKQRPQSDDQSMEEILQSIRRIIAEEEQDGSAPATMNTAPDDFGGSDVLELTDMVTENGSVMNVHELDEPATVENDVLGSIDQLLDQPEPEPLPEPVAAPIPEPAPYIPEPEPDNDLDSLLSAQSATAVAETFRTLRRQESPPPAARSAPLPFRNGDTVEDLVVEALRPMLKDWLDTHLPGLVERIVAREVSRLTRGE